MHHCTGINLVFLLGFFLWAEDTVFDASQYAFFGKDLVEEVELGGLEDGEEDLPVVDLEEEEFFFDRQEVPFSHRFDIFSTFYLIYSEMEPFWFVGMFTIFSEELGNCSIFLWVLECGSSAMLEVSLCTLAASN